MRMKNKIMMVCISPFLIKIFIDHDDDDDLDRQYFENQRKEDKIENDKLQEEYRQKKFK